VYASAWLRHHWPAAFCAGLLNAQPMGFWAPNTLVADARRHGVITCTPDANRSAAVATLEPCAESAGGVAVRLGVGSVRNVGDELAQRIADGRPYASMEDLVRRTGASVAAVEALATAGAFASLSQNDRRRADLWAAGAVAQAGPERLQGVVTGADAPELPGMSEMELAAADTWATGVSPGRHP